MKTAVLAERNVGGSGAIGKQDVQGHDLLSLLIKSNIASDVPESMRMSDSEILSRESHFSFPSSCSKFTENNVRFRDSYIPTCGA